MTGQSKNKNKLSYNKEPKKYPIRNQIEDIIIPKHAKLLLQDAMSYSGFSCSSDHRPVMAKLRMQLYRMKPLKPTTALDFNCLKNEEIWKSYPEHFTEILEIVNAKIDQSKDPTGCYEVLLEAAHKATTELLSKVRRR